MIKIGKFECGFAPISMLVLFIVLSIFAVFSAFSQVKPEYPMPLSSLIIINETLALIATLVYGIIVHLIMSFLQWKRKRKMEI